MYYVGIVNSWKHIRVWFANNSCQVTLSMHKLVGAGCMNQCSPLPHEPYGCASHSIQNTRLSGQQISMKNDVIEYKGQLPASCESFSLFCKLIGRQNKELLNHTLRVVILLRRILVGLLRVKAIASFLLAMTQEKHRVLCLDFHQPQDMDKYSVALYFFPLHLGNARLLVLNIWIF